jgi:hypothetical protein
MTNLDAAILIFTVGALAGTLVIRYSHFERESHCISDPPRNWREAIQGGALLGAIFALSYVGVLVAGWSTLWN